MSASPLHRWTLDIFLLTVLLLPECVSVCRQHCPVLSGLETLILFTNRVKDFGVVTQPECGVKTDEVTDDPHFIGLVDQSIIASASEFTVLVFFYVYTFLWFRERVQVFF